MLERAWHEAAAALGYDHDKPGHAMGVTYSMDTSPRWTAWLKRDDMGIAYAPEGMRRHAFGSVAGSRQGGWQVQRHVCDLSI
jgi:hypothetical protein